MSFLIFALAVLIGWTGLWVGVWAVGKVIIRRRLKRKEDFDRERDEHWAYTRNRTWDKRGAKGE